MIDKHYTPERMAGRIVEAVQLAQPRVVADFAAGEGALLHAARVRWEASALVATDIDPGAITALRSRFTGIDADVCDFLSQADRSKCSALSRVLGQVSLGIINPPFSCRGNTKFAVNLFDRSLTCSKAMAFVVNSIPYLCEDGQLVALLPSSCLTSQKDASALSAIAERFEVKQIGRAQPYDFPGCSVNVSFVNFRSLRARENVIALTTREKGGDEVSPFFHAVLFRGSVPVHEVGSSEAGPLPFVHSTNLRNGSVEFEKMTSIRRSLVQGPAVFLPRVGRFDPGKICLYENEGCVVLSDCVIALLCANRSGSLALFNHMRANASHIQKFYVGSCAPYITLAGLQAALTGLGVSVGVSKDRSMDQTLPASVASSGPAAA